MGSRNVETVRKQFEAFNRRDIDWGIQAYAENAIANDRATGETYKGRDEIKTWLSTYLMSASDGKITLENVIDAGDTVVVQARFEGTNDGPLGPLPATGRHFSVEFCDLVHFNDQGEIVKDEDYFDQLTLLTQLGHMEGPPV